MSYLSGIVSGAASLGLLTGFISGVLFLVLSGFRWIGRIRAGLCEEELHRPPKQFFTVDSTSREFADGEQFCDEEKWKKCLQRGFEEEESRKKKKECEIRNSVSPDTAQIRELIEKLVETIIGGSLDGITVGRLSAHSSYLAMFEKYHGLLCGKLAKIGISLHLSGVHDVSNSMRASLNRLIQRIITEAMNLPERNDRFAQANVNNNKISGNDEVEDKSYEDILATAILNKVIENFQKNSDRESEPFSKSNKRKHSRTKKPKKMSVEEEEVEEEEEEEEEGFSSGSDWSKSRRSEKLSLAVEEQIEEVSTAFGRSDDVKVDYPSNFIPKIPFSESGRIPKDARTDDENSEEEEEEEEEEDGLGMTLNNSTNSWEENWLFQKKRIRSTPNAHHPVPVPMLVPNPSEDFRALVGGIDADDLSDMSDCSNSALEDLIVSDSRPKSGDGEGGKVKGIRTEWEKEGDRKERETMEEDVTMNRDGSEKDKVGTSGETIRKESNDFEAFRSLEKSSDIAVDDSVGLSQNRDRETSQEQSAEAISNLSFGEKKKESIRCPIAEREMEKWNNPVSIPENPYSLENIEKREKERRKNDYFQMRIQSEESIDFPDYTSQDACLGSRSEDSIVIRDYYVNASKNSSGMPHKTQAIRSPFEGNDQNLASSTKPEIITEYQFVRFPIPGTEKSNGFESPKREILPKSEFSLPNVKELAKQFALEESDLNSSRNEKDRLRKLERFKENSFRDSKCWEEKEEEIDYSPVPVSEIVLNMTNSLAISSDRKPKPRTNNEDSPVRKKMMADASRKEVHSLTARSISKEFREGLKNNLNRKLATAIKTSGEHEQGDVVCHGEKLSSSPTPLVDLKNIKKFWEEIITANSNDQK